MTSPLDLLDGLNNVCEILYRNSFYLDLPGVTENIASHWQLLFWLVETFKSLLFWKYKSKWFVSWYK